MKKGKVAEWFKAPVLKTGGAKAPVGSNPTLSDFNRLMFALGMARGLIHKCTKALPNTVDEDTVNRIDIIIEEVCYGIVRDESGQPRPKDIEDNYNFSNGVRGKYIERLKTKRGKSK